MADYRIYAFLASMDSRLAIPYPKSGKPTIGAACSEGAIRAGRAVVAAAGVGLVAGPTRLIWWLSNANVIRESGSVGLTVKEISSGALGLAAIMARYLPGQVDIENHGEQECDCDKGHDAKSETCPLNTYWQMN